MAVPYVLLSGYLGTSATLCAFFILGLPYSDQSFFLLECMDLYVVIAGVSLSIPYLRREVLPLARSGPTSINAPPALDTLLSPELPVERRLFQRISEPLES